MESCLVIGEFEGKNERKKKKILNRFKIDKLFLNTTPNLFIFILFFIYKFK